MRLIRHLIMRLIRRLIRRFSWCLIWRLIMSFSWCLIMGFLKVLTEFKLKKTQFKTDNKLVYKLNLNNIKL